ATPERSAALGAAVDELRSAAPALAERVASSLTPKVLVDPARPSTYILERRAAGSAARYRLELEPLASTTIDGRGTAVSIRGPRQTQFRVRAFFDRAPL